MISNSGRFFVNPSEPPRTALVVLEFRDSLERLVTNKPPVHTCSTGWKFCGFYSGPTSIAYMFYRLSQILPNMEFKQQSLYDWAEAYLALGARQEKSPPTPNNCGIANETLAHTALTAVMLQETHLVNQICAFEPAINAEGEDGDQGSNEWLYGRAGYLYILRLCRTFTEKQHPTTYRATALVNNTIEKTVNRILASPQPWTWHGKQYLGAAHGTTGIICQLVLSQPSVASKVQPILNRLLDAQHASGSFPSSTGSSNPDRLVQFCHGSPGFALSFARLAYLWPDLEGRIRDALRKAKEDTWRRGLLTKPPCLCHGIAGNALAFDTGGGGDLEERNRDEARFKHFSAFMSTPEMERVGWLREMGSSNEFVGLYTGEAGRAWVWGRALHPSPDCGPCIGYNDI
ncbi:hypothetical protein GGR53DRAFT_497058 [Hypoxylon sp. FL1150]|nr:hypothetical protein GGR53DRAFT_497058 [Hypoxylon sp. FL1150]